MRREGAVRGESAGEVRCVAFDLDGVVIQSGPSHDYFEAVHGITRADFMAFFQGPHRRAMRGEVDLFEVLPDALDSWGWTDSMESFAKIWMESCADCDPAVRETILALHRHGIECCLATNQDNRRGAFLDALPELRELFPQRFYSYAMRLAKPEPAYFDAITQQLERDPEEMLFVDDRPENVAAARSCGWRAEVCTGADSLRRTLHTHLPGWSLRHD